MISVDRDTALHQTNVDVRVYHLKSINLEMGRFTNSCISSDMQ